jgi:hypothetical protein
VVTDTKRIPAWVGRFVPDEEADLITRDGMALQSIRVARIPFDKDPPNTKRKLAKDMLPQEVADVVIGDFFQIEALRTFRCSRILRR